jgi:type III secretion protein J
MRRMLMLLPLLFLVGCRTSLFEGLDEDQANRIIAVLSHEGIAGYKERNADKTWTVSVDGNDAVAATELANAYALPRGGHANLGELFSRQGLITSPEEDRVRFIYGLTQELSETLEKIDGVLVARVHIVQPEVDPLNGPPAPPSASVMVRYRSDFNLELMRDKIRALVAGSVEGLTPERVNLTLIPVTPAVPATTAADACSDGDACRCAGGMRHGSATLVLGAIALAVMLVSGLVLIWRRGIRSFSPTFFRRRGKRSQQASSPDGTTQQEDKKP